MWLFFTGFLLIVGSKCTIVQACDPIPELTYDEFYRHWLNKQLDRYGKNASIYSGTGTQILPNYTTIDSLDIHVIKKRGSFQLQLNDVLINGFSNIVVDKLVAEIYSGKEYAYRLDTLYELNFSIPRLDFYANYSSNGTWTNKSLDCTGRLRVVFEKVSGRAGIFLQQAVGPNRVDFLKVKIRKNVLTGYMSNNIEIQNCSTASFRYEDWPVFFESIGTELKPLLIKHFEEKIRNSLNDVFSWDSYYAVLFGKVLQ